MENDLVCQLNIKPISTCDLQVIHCVFEVYGVHYPAGAGQFEQANFSALRLHIRCH